MESPAGRLDVTADDEQSILVLNVGSSTLKFGLFPIEEGDEPFLHGVLEYGGSAGGQFRVVDTRGAKSESRQVKADRGSAVPELLRYLDRTSQFGSVRAVGHRLVHGGSKLRDPVRIDARVRALLEEVVPLAPDHLPTELGAIDDVSRFSPSMAQVACFDTAFHSEIPRVARLFGLPRSLSESGVVRYGFHGLSYEYVADILGRHGDLPARTIIAHLGSGASITALRNGVSVDTSMGLTPTGGMVMSTRSGDLDPGVVLYLLRSAGLSADDVDDAVKRSGGLLGISGSSSDVRELLAASSTDPRAEEAIAVFCYQAKKFIGAYAAVLGGIDALVFTGGIGERSDVVRTRVCEGLGHLGLELDAKLNRESAPTISAARSKVTVRTIRTNEEAMIARHTRSAIQGALGASKVPV
ncbi:MAG: acetate/propionate family kinase [Gemmatimonadaceae bacterium]